MLDVVLDNVLDIKQDTWDDFLVGLFALVVTTTFGTPLHVLSGYLVGLEVTRQTPFMKVTNTVTQSLASCKNLVRDTVVQG